MAATIDQIWSAELEVHGAKGSLLGIEDLIRGIYLSTSLTSEESERHLNALETKKAAALQRLAACQAEFTRLCNEEY